MLEITVTSMLLVLFFKLTDANNAKEETLVEIKHKCCVSRLLMKRKSIMFYVKAN